MPLTVRAWRAELAVRVWMLLGRTGRARERLAHWLAADPRAARPRQVRAYLRAQDGDLEGACKDYAALLAQRPDDAASWFNFGFVHQRRGDADQAALAFLKATALDPSLDRAWYGLGTVAMTQGHWHDAAEALQEAARLQPLSPFAWVQLARVEWRRGRPQAAWAVVERLRGFEPGAAARLTTELNDAPDVMACPAGGHAPIPSHSLPPLERPNGEAGPPRPATRVERTA